MQRHRAGIFVAVHQLFPWPPVIFRELAVPIYVYRPGVIDAVVPVFRRVRLRADGEIDRPADVEEPGELIAHLAVGETFLVRRIHQVAGEAHEAVADPVLELLARHRAELRVIRRRAFIEETVPLLLRQRQNVFAEDHHAVAGGQRRAFPVSHRALTAAQLRVWPDQYLVRAVLAGVPARPVLRGDAAVPGERLLHQRRRHAALLHRVPIDGRPVAPVGLHLELHLSGIAAGFLRLHRRLT
ncbi:MAG: hypothetical protein BWY76_03051 [bacterium ADurb.Bin429]|nr:MAG: hypothetical protein BWY76_03051 [bacterium ADurb.Bin429]